jgi:hypothetical protein
MKYIDYVLDIEENSLTLDNDFKLNEQKNENGWGNLPKSWKQGDLFEIKIGSTGRVSFVRKQ